MRFRWLLLLAMLCNVTMLGCGGGEKESANTNDPAGGEQVSEVGAADVKRRDVASLPGVDAYLPPLDEGRVRIAPPEGWRPVSRDAKYLARFVKGEAAALPRIAVTAADSPSPEVTNASADDVAAFLAPLQAKSKEGKRKPVEPVRPIILGDQLFARHVRMARYNDEPCAIVSLQTVRDGRLYTVDLYVEAGTRGDEYAKHLKADQDAAYAVAANMRFGDDPGHLPMTPPVETAPAEEKSPAAESPEDANP